MDFYFIVTQLISGFTMATLLFLVASGLTLIFGVGNIFNFAHGSFYMIGAYFGYQLVSVWKINFWIALVAAGTGAGLVGAAAEFLFLRRIYGRAQEGGFQILLTYGLILIFDDLGTGADDLALSNELGQPHPDLRYLRRGLQHALGRYGYALLRPSPLFRDRGLQHRPVGTPRRQGVVPARHPDRTGRRRRAVLLLGLLVIRVSGVYFTMLALAFAQLAWQVTFRRNSWPFFFRHHRLDHRDSFSQGCRR